MTVYVDELMEYPTGIVKGARRAKFWCHMYADSIKELDEFAQKIGMKLEWHQVSRGGIHHYDLTQTYRKTAIENGALVREISLDDLLRLRRKQPLSNKAKTVARLQPTQSQNRAKAGPLPPPRAGARG